MEINKHNYQEIKSVKEGDRIVFNEDYIYRVTQNYIHGCHGKDNEAIFRKIGVKQDKVNFCKEAYGYTPKDGFCPEYKWGDYDAALRLIKKIFDKMYPELKKKSVIDADEFTAMLDEVDHASKPIKVRSTDSKFTIKVSKIKPKIIL